MKIVGYGVIKDFGLKHPQSRKPLLVWENVVKATNYENLNDLKKSFPSADYVPNKYIIFNICGNKYRMITEIEFGAAIIGVKAIFTHAEYSQKKNKEALKKGDV